MAVWRTKACEVFGFEANEFSYSRGKIELMAELVSQATRACMADDLLRIDEIVNYIEWFCRQESEEMKSAVDLAFFLPVFESESEHQLLISRFANELIDSKREILA